MRKKDTLGLVMWGAAGILCADVLFDANGFEPPVYLPGTVLLQNQRGMNWVEWTPAGGNNANPDFAMIQSEVFRSGTQALVVADAESRIIVRANGLKIQKQDVFYIDGWYKTEAENDPGLIRITLRTKGASGQDAKLFSLDTVAGRARIFDNDNPSARANFQYGEWTRITIEVRLKENAYKLVVNGSESFGGTLAKSGSAAELLSWEVDVEANDPKRAPRGKNVFYVDDLKIQSVSPLEETIG